MRTRIGPARAWQASVAAETAPAGDANAAKNASPCVSTSTPPCRANAARSTRRWSLSAAAYGSTPSSCNSFVEFSTSVKRNVTVPRGSSRMREALVAAVAVMPHVVHVLADDHDGCEDQARDQHAENDVKPFLGGGLREG